MKQETVSIMDISAFCSWTAMFTKISMRGLQRKKICKDNKVSTIFHLISALSLINRSENIDKINRKS